MHTYNTSNKKQNLKVVLSFIAMGFAVIVVAAVCIFMVNGWSFDFKKNKVEQMGLMQFRSNPDNALITLDGKNLPSATPTKQAVEAGTHVVSMSKNGYQTWQKTVSVSSGQLLWLNYALLFPQKMVQTPIYNMSALAQVLPTADHKWELLLPDASRPSFTLLDLRDPRNTKTTTIDLPVALVGQAPATYSLVEWDFSGQHVLVSETVGDKKSYLRFSRDDPASGKNITASSGLAISDLHFSGTSGNTFYALENGNIRKVDIASGQISEPLVDKVTSFTLYSDSDIAYARATEDAYSAGVILDGKVTEDLSFDTTIPLQVNNTVYYNEHYLAVVRASHVYLIKNPEQKGQSHYAQIVDTEQPIDVKWVDFSSNGRFFLVGNGGRSIVYDIELKKTSNINMPGSYGDPTKPLQWLDEYHVVSLGENKVRVGEFDGENQKNIVDALPGFPVNLSSDNKYLYSITKTENGSFEVQRTNLTLDN